MPSFARKEPTYEQALAYDAEQTFIDLNGGIRGGKTECALEKLRKELILQPGLKALIARDTGPVLYTTTKQHLEAILDQELIENSWAKPTPRFLLKNGSQVFLVAYEDFATTKAGGTEYGFILLDEADRFKASQWTYFKGRLSQKYGKAVNVDGTEYMNEIKRRFLVTVHNPAGRGYLWQIFVRDHPLAPLNADPKYLRVNFRTETLQERINPEYVADMQDTPQHLRDRLLGFDESPLEGLVFPHFSRELNVCDMRDFTPPHHWVIRLGIDWGRQTPCVCLWCAITEEGCMIFFAEHRLTHTEIPDHSRMILGKTAKLRENGMGDINAGYIDPSTDYDEGKAPFTIFQQFINAGLWFLQKAPRLRVEDRSTRMGSLIMPDKRIKYHPLTGEYREGGWPRMIFTQDCEATIREFESWEYPKRQSDLKDPKNKPEEKNDHGIDAASYVVVKYYEGENAPEHPSTTEYNRKVHDMDWREAVQKDFENQVNNANGKGKKRNAFGQI